MDGNLEIVKPYLWIGFDPNLLWEGQTIPLNLIWSQFPLRVSNHTSESDLIPISSECQTMPLNWIWSQSPLRDCQTTRCSGSWFNSRRTCYFVWLIWFCFWYFSLFSVDICWLRWVINFVNNSFERMYFISVCCELYIFQIRQNVLASMNFCSMFSLKKLKYYFFVTYQVTVISPISS